MSVHIIGAYISLMVVTILLDSTKAEINPPCFMKDHETALVTDQSSKFPTNILSTILTLISAVENRLIEMKHLCTPTGDPSFIQGSLNIMKLKQTIFFSKIMSNRIIPLPLMTEHYNILNTLALYLEEIRPSSVDKAAWNSLVTIQGYVYDVMCVMKMYLRSLGFDPKTEVPKGQLSPLFYENVKFPPDRCLQQLLEYTVVKDIRTVARYLEHIYSTYLAFRIFPV